MLVLIHFERAVGNEPLVWSDPRKLSLAHSLKDIGACRAGPAMRPGQKNNNKKTVESFRLETSYMEYVHGSIIEHTYSLFIYLIYITYLHYPNLH